MSGYLPQELEIKILTRLPPKSLIRFRCVSKSWNSLISSPYFISMHTQQAIISSGTDKIMIRRYCKAEKSEVYTVQTDNQDFPDGNTIRIEYPFRDLSRFYYRIVGACNGLLCLSDDLFGQTGSILLWNPAIKQTVALPAPQVTFENTSTYMSVVGFGFDVQNNDYKVIRIDYVQRDYGYVVPPNVEVYALSTGNWRKPKGEVPNNCVVEYFWSQVVVNGNVHWIGYRNMGSREKVENLVMIFNISLEVFDEMQLPNALENELPINLYTLSVEGSIGVVQYDERVWGKSCSIWVMKEYGDMLSWAKQYNVQLQEGLGMVLGFRPNGDVLLTARNQGLLSYSPVTGVSMNVGILGTKDSFYVGTYVETLELLLEGKQARERVPSDSESENESCVEGDDDRVGDVEKSEFWMQSSMSQYLNALLKR